ncbi:hypothetical protein ACWEDZ_02820 [Streptomyces sp. NPDC005047]
MEHINFEDRQVAQGEEFEPLPGYRVLFVRIENDRLILRDSAGEFSRPIRRATPPVAAPAPTLGDRRTVVEDAPDGRPLVDETIYVLTQQMCVPGGWKNIKTSRCRAPQNLAGIYQADGQDITDAKLRSFALALFKGATPVVEKHPYTKLSALVLKVRSQEGTQGEAGAWDDPGVAMEMADLLADSRTV